MLTILDMVKNTKIIQEDNVKHDKLIDLLFKNNISFTKDIHLFRAYGIKNYAEWYHADEEIEAHVCIYANGTKDDLMSDFSCGVFPKTYKRFLELMKAV